ncbi:hypothetical protein ACFQRL_12080 [Microbacterium fluvii]|uniref:Alpha/beta hydrolase n=1 Tax=Microbacterium fluvii TaxID=415215 RepID=A0ABW2HEJ6_9MICO|nr:hypothetical protein [Microbacterium fluvii]MCU4673334.1 hypothetical protein [Microbacterium fluvii]
MTRRLDDFAPQHPAWDLLTGVTPFQAFEGDSRFPFSLYVPRRYRELAGELPVLVSVHGTGRKVERSRDQFIPFAERHGVAVLAPLFPVGIGEPDDVSNYKELAYRGIRFDEIVIGMLQQAAARWRLRTDRFFLAGFSGGGQFAHRFAYLHPERLLAVSIGAPGRVTLPDTAEPWPHGVGGAGAVFGADVDLAAVAAVPMQVVVGADDHAAELLAAVAEDPREARAGATRVARATALAEELRALGADVDLSIVPGAGHDPLAVTAEVVAFFERVPAAAAPTPAPEGAPA